MIESQYQTTEFNASGRINGSLHRILDQLIHSEENDQEEFLDCRSDVNSAADSNQDNIFQQRQRDALCSINISYLEDTLFDGESNDFSQPIQLK